MVCCCCSVAKSCLTLCHTMDCRMTYFPVLHCLSEFAQTHVHWISDAIQSSHSLSPLLLLSSIFLSFRVFSNGLALHIRWPKYWSLWISHSNEYSGFISFRIDLFDLPAIQETLRIFSRTTIRKLWWLDSIFQIRPPQVLHVLTSAEEA